MVPGGPNGFYVKPSMLANISSMLQQGIGAYQNHKLDGDQTALDKNSMDAFNQQSSHLNDQVRNADQDGIENTAESQRFANRAQTAASMGSGVDAGQIVGRSPANSDMPLPPLQNAMPPAPMGCTNASRPSTNATGTTSNASADASASAGSVSHASGKSVRCKSS
jgi:hypothetical protein